MSSHKLLVHPTPANTQAECRLVCFPWAGAGAAYYISWTKKIAPTIEVIAIRPPGREVRLKEPNYKSLAEAVNDITEAVWQNLTDKPFAFFGHSLGSLISYAVAVRLKEKYNIEPVSMFVSAMSAPHAAQVQDKDKISNRSDVDFLAYMKTLGGTPAQVLENEEMMSMFLPSLRADYTLYEQFKYELPPSPPLSCPIHIFGGQDDKKRDLKGWSEVTCSTDTSCTVLPGGHFYFKAPANESNILTHINGNLNNLVRLTDQPL